MADDKSMREKEARVKAETFGTMKLPENGPWDAPLRIPPQELLRQPFKHRDAVAYVSCNHCGFFGTLDREYLNLILDQVNENSTGPVWDETKRAQFDGTKQFIAASGCPRCSPFMAFQVVDVPEDSPPPLHGNSSPVTDRKHACDSASQAGHGKGRQ